MVVKKVLIFLPVLFVIYLAQSVLWVPSAATVGQDPSRLNRHIIYLPGDVSSMNPWLSASASDSDVFGFIFEALLGSDGNFEKEYQLCDRAEIREEIVLHLDPDMDPAIIQEGLTEFLATTYPTIFERVSAPEDYRVDSYQGWNQGRYVVDLSGETTLAGDSIPDYDRFMAPYRIDTSKPDQPTDGIKRLVIHLRPDPTKTYNYKEHELPNAVAKDIEAQLATFFETNQGRQGFVKGFDAEFAAFNWYRAQHGLKPITLQAPTFGREVAGEPAKEGRNDVDGDGVSEEAPKEAAKEATKEAVKDEPKPAEGSAKPLADGETAKAEVKLAFNTKDFPELDKVTNFKAHLTATLKHFYELEKEKPKPEHVIKWIEDSAKMLTEAFEASEKAAGDKKFSTYKNTSPTARFYEFPLLKMHLREGVKWHDYGTKWESGPREGQVIQETFDSADVAFTFAFGHHDDVNSKRKTYSKSIRQIRISNDHEVAFLYDGVYSPAMQDLSSASIIPEHRFRTSDWIEEARVRDRGPAGPAREKNDYPNYDYRKAFPASQLRFQLDPVGTGPMTLHALNGNLLPKWRSGEMIRLERFDDYWNPVDTPVYQFLDFYIFDPDLGQETAEVAFLSGGVDQYGVRPHQVSKFEANREDYYLYKRPNLSYEYIAFNLEREPFNDLKIRQALTMAIRVEEIVKYVVYGEARRINQPAYPMLQYYDEEFVPDYTFRQGEHKGKSLKESGLQYFPFDLAEAAALLDEAGWKLNSSGVREKGGKEFRFKLTNGGGSSSARGKIAYLAIEQWKSLGVIATFEDKEFNVFLSEHIYPRNFDCVTLGWNGGTGFDKRQLWHSGQFTPGGLNFVAYNDKESDAIMDELVKEYDEEAQVKLAFKLNARIANQCPYVFLFSPLSNVAMSRSINWAKPVLDDKGDPVLDADGKVKREMRPINDRELMAYKYGPRIKRIQFMRSKEYLFPASEEERYQVGLPDLTYKMKKSE